jgi:hypothetical protein
MANRPISQFRIDSLYGGFTTAASTSRDKVRLDGTLGNSFSVLCMVQCSTDGQGTGISATAVGGNVHFSVTEASAASANSSVIAGATMQLGAATANDPKGVIKGLLTVTSNLATNITVTVNGVDYHTTAAGATALTGAAQIANLINGVGGSNKKVPHYHAVSGYTSKLTVLIEPEDDLGTGITVTSTAAAATAAWSMLNLQGVINISLDKLSTVTPKYIGLSVSSYTGATSLVTAYLIRNPSGNPCFAGRVIDLTT